MLIIFSEGVPRERRNTVQGPEGIFGSPAVSLAALPLCVLDLHEDWNQNRGYLQFATLNQPRVEAAYSDWLASIERITVERSLPDPRLMFSADIKEVVMSAMAGLIQEFAGPGKLSARAAVASAESSARYFGFEINRDEIARYGLNVADVQEILGVALGGMPITTTVEGLERYTINLRYDLAYDEWKKNRVGQANPEMRSRTNGRIRMRSDLVRFKALSPHGGRSRGLPQSRGQLRKK